jgi:KUP system potassium uptake protein
MSNHVPGATADASYDATATTPTLHTVGNRLTALTIAAIGIVYGDIGTSPLYTMKTIFSGEHAVHLDEANLLGVVSLIFWGLMMVVSLKYVTLIMRADNHGEGGIMALMALALQSVKRESRWHRMLLITGLVGAALFYGDGVITPAISVLSAVEGLEVSTPALKPYIVPITVAVLIALYMVQHRGTAGIGKWFGPVMLVWFAALAVMGAINIMQAPSIIGALNPLHAFSFMLRNRWSAFVALGAVVLAFTGAEALYADMGHFGRKPIRIAWAFIVAPALTLNYLGQGALLLAHPDAVSNPFFQQLGAWSVYPLVALSTVATVIASQATISGTFSMTHQAISLGAMPRMRVIHTSDYEIGQIYVPLVNWMQLAAVLVAVISFGSSDRLGAAYGIAVTATMLATSILTFFVIHNGWKYSLGLSLFSTGFFVMIDATLFSANTLKFMEGGWFPLLIGGLIMLLMMTWERGREIVSENMACHVIPMEGFIASLFQHPPPRVEGTAVFFRPAGEGVPHALLHNLMHNKVLHQRIVFLTAQHSPVPTIADTDRVEMTPLGHDCYDLTVKYGFKEDRDIPHALDLCQSQGLTFDLMETSFFISRQTVVPTVGAGMALWREGLFAAMFRNARDAADYYRIPANRVIELGTKLEI